ncbi:FecCD family ABC transporter permease [Sciscionella marina]|uniref:FecCD family ABC transporter permease n=1 Tax=Sciscionella marina TaxID=508770 RepID=UPI000360E369|nr:iron ABC transporter permease [Sciscionella marina]
MTNHRLVTSGIWLLGLVVGLVVLAVVSFGIGRYLLDPLTVLRTLLGETGGVERTVVFEVRAPRILGALLVGAALSASGAAYQSVFRNPLVSPDILGVSAAAGFGASLALLLGLASAVLQVLAFGGGILAAVLSVLIGRVVGRGSTIVFVLGGVVVGAMFQALISVTQYLADPQNTLPEITFWLLGGLGRTTLDGLVVPAVIVAGCLGVLWTMRWPLTVLAVGDDEAHTLGVHRGLVWSLVIGSATLMTATVVSVAGIIGWVGLVVPHLARLVTGPAFAKLLPVAALLGAGYLLVVDDIARAATAVDLPLGILTALVGAPFFVVLLAKAGRAWR